MQFKLSMQILNASQVLEAVIQSPHKKIPNKTKHSIETRFNKLLKSRNSIKPQSDLSSVFLSYCIHGDEYLYWLALKLSLTETKRVQSTLNFAIQTAVGTDLYFRIDNYVYPLLTDDFQWTLKSNVSELQNWLELTIRLNVKSIFTPKYRELLLIELEPKLEESLFLKPLIDLIYNNIKPDNPIRIYYRSLGEFCAIFSFLHGKNEVNLSQTELSEWIKRNIQLINGDSIYIKASQKTIKKYIEENRLLPSHLKPWT